MKSALLFAISAVFATSQVAAQVNAQDAAGYLLRTSTDQRKMKTPSSILLQTRDDGIKTSVGVVSEKPRRSKSSVYYIDHELNLACTAISTFIFVIGLIGNAISFWALKYSMKKSGTAAFYLRCLAITDSLTILLSNSTVLLTMISRPILSDFVADQIIAGPGICQPRLFLMFTCRAVSVFIIVIFTIERCLVVLHPILVQSKWCTVPYAKRILLGAVLFAIAFNLPSFFSFRYAPKKVRSIAVTTDKFNRANTNLTNGTTGNDVILLCRVNKIFFKMMLINFFLVTLIPALIVITSNVIIIQSLVARERHALNKSAPRFCNVRSPKAGLAGGIGGGGGASIRSTLSTVTTQSVPSNTVVNKPKTPTACTPEQKIKSRQRIQVTKRLILISTTFVVLSFPLLIVRSISSFEKFLHIKNTAEQKRHRANALAASLTIFFLNFSVNFFLYSLSMQEFTQAVKALLRLDVRSFQMSNSKAATHSSNAQTNNENNEMAAMEMPLQNGGENCDSENDPHNVVESLNNDNKKVCDRGPEMAVSEKPVDGALYQDNLDYMDASVVIANNAEENENCETLNLLPVSPTPAAVLSSRKATS